MPLTNFFSASLGFIIFLIGTIIQVATLLIYQEDTAYAWQVLFSLFFPFAVFAKGLTDLGDYARDDEVGTKFRL
jgi:ABC-type anion transport system duplicated permease subunit